MFPSFSMDPIFLHGTERITPNRENWSSP